MTNTVVQRVEQLTTQDQQPMTLDLKFGLGLYVGDLLPDPNNEVDDDTRAITVEVLTAQDNEKQI